MKIGILIKRFEDLANWELRIINEIIDNPQTELTLLIQDGRNIKKNTKSLKNRIIQFFASENKLSQGLLGLQCSIENLIFKKPFTVDKNRIINQLETIDSILLYPERNGFLDVFSDEDGQRIKDFDLDVILKHEFIDIEGPLLHAAKFGIWSFQHGNNSINCGNLVGFWEIIFNQPYVEVTLQQLTPELGGGQIIDKAFFNRHWSFVKTKRLVFEASVSLLLKNIRELQSGSYSPTTSMVNFSPLYKSPDFKSTLQYALSFYVKVFDKFIRNINTTLFGARYGCWTLFIGEGDFMNASLFRLKPTKIPKNEFWADPFIFKHKEGVYIFFENYDYRTKRGKISCGKIKNKELVDVIDVLNFEYHLSFPFIFEENGELFLMPETKENNRLELYRCVGFPAKWELYATAFEGEKVVDAFFYSDENNQKWMFVNKAADLNTTADNELFIYKVESLKLNNLEPHKLNPVIINSRKARNGGAIFRYKDEIYRPSQANIDGVYGRALHINKIEKLTIDEYIEKDIITVYPNFHKGLIAMHHLHQSDGMFVIDAAYRKK